MAQNKSEFKRLKYKKVLGYHENNQIKASVDKKLK
jgi:hypothetical protein